VKVYIYPADDSGCGFHRLIWPATYLREAGHDVVVDMPREGRLKARFWQCTEGHHHGRVDAPEDADVIVMQRVTDLYQVETIKVLREQGIAVVVDVDDDLDSISPGNPAWWQLHPRGASEDHPHSWRATGAACRAATLVTVSTPALLPRYATHGRGVVIDNFLADHYYERKHVDSDWVGWPGTIWSHSNDPQVTRGAIGRLIREGVRFRVLGDPENAGRAFGLEVDPPGTGRIDLADWPRALAVGAGVGIAPLADTRFNAAKSRLKPLELAACGVPWVGSPRAEYDRFHRLGCGVLAKDNTKDWYRVVRRLVHDEDRRRELSEAGLAVAATQRLRDHAWRHLEAWEEALRIHRSTSSRVTSTRN